MGSGFSRILGLLLAAPACGRGRYFFFGAGEGGFVGAAGLGGLK